jgi:hypothetical protein
MRNIEEIIEHLSNSNNFFKLKDLISSIDNFLLLYNSKNKFDLNRMWLKLIGIDFYLIIIEKNFDPC